MKFYANKLALCSAAAFGLAMSATFIACGDENTTEVTEQTGMDVLAKGEKLPDCTKDNAGDMLYVADSAAAYYCVDGKWTVLNGKNGENGQQGASPEAKDGAGCSAKANEKGIEVSCDGKVIGTISNGEPGASATGNDGANCSVADNGDGEVVVKCGKNGTPVTLYKAMCGTDSYDPAEKFCYEGELYSCGDKPYDPSKFLCDVRNNQLYKTVTIDISYKVVNKQTQQEETAQYKETWMAQNMNYNTNAAGETNSWCGGGSGKQEGDCSVYGRLYTWNAATNACPKDWHLPSNTEWEALRKAVGETVAGTALKSTSGWDRNKDGNVSGDGTDDYGFSAIPAGFRYDEGDFFDTGSHAYFWTNVSNEGGGSYVMSVILNFDSESMSLRSNYKVYGYSVRCIKDSEQSTSN